MPYKLKVYDGELVLEETGLDYALDAAEVDAAWYVDHDGATKVEIINDLGDVVQTVGEKRRMVVRPLMLRPVLEPLPADLRRRLSGEL